MEKRTVLFVDDEEKNLKSLKRCFLNEPYEVLFAESGKKALEILQQNKVHVLVTDRCMPEMSGPELLRIVKESYPCIVRMLLSAYVPVSTLLDVVNDIDVFKCLPKPCEVEKMLKPAVEEALDYYNAFYSKSDAPVGTLQ